MEILEFHPKTLHRWVRVGKIRVVKTVGSISRIWDKERKLKGL